ncbi:MAG: TolC family protein [Prevotellaceae bacterium]|jgi:outer membrane protein|nr:TolC family protein [Prevotellaceae bacterium]
MKKIFLYLCAACFCGNISAQAYSLQQCIDLALENNRQVKQQSLSKQERDIAYRQARQNLLPNLNASAGQSFSFGRSKDASDTYQSSNSSSTSFGISSSLTLFDGLRMKYNIDTRRAEKYASEYDLEKVKTDITLAVNTAFLQVLMNKELLKIAENQLSLTGEMFTQRQKLIDNGKLAQGDILELQAQQSKEELSRIQAENALKLSLLDLAQIVEIDDYQNFDVRAEVPLDGNLGGLEDIYEQALQTRPEIKSANYRLQSNEKNVSIARSAYFPTLTLGASLGTNYYNLQNLPTDPFGTQLSDNMNASVGLNLSIPIFNRFDTRNNVATAKLSVESSRLALENTKKELYKNIQQAHQNALSAKVRWEAADKSAKATQEAYRYAEQKYNAGRASQYELFQAKNNLAQALSEETQAQFEYAFRVRILELF